MPVGEKGLERRERRRLRTRDAILEAAKKRFLLQGYRETRMEDIADEADVSIGSLYRQFHTKEELYREFLEGTHVRLGELVREGLATDAKYLEPAYDDTKSVVEQLEAIGAAYLRFGIEHPLYFQLVTVPGAFGPLDAEDERLLADGIQALVDRVADLIERGITADQPELAIPPQRDPAEADPARYAKTAADFLHAAWNGLIALSLREDKLRVDIERLEKIADVGVQIVRDGLRANRK